jgi:hypothetical protein
MSRCVGLCGNFKFTRERKAGGPACASRPLAQMARQGARRTCTVDADQQPTLQAAPMHATRAKSHGPESVCRRNNCKRRGRTGKKKGYTFPMEKEHRLESEGRSWR